MRLISFTICPFVQRITALLEAKKQTYDIEFISLKQKPEWFLKLSPNGQVPLLITDNNEAIFESDAIAEYLEEVTPNALFPANPVAKAQERAWSYMAAKNYLVQCSAQRSSSKEVLQERASKLNMAFAKLENKLTATTFFNGASFDSGAEGLGMVDIAWLPLLHRAAIIERYSGYDFISGFGKVKVLQENILATGLPQKSVALDFEQKFIAFYLAENTYLGQSVEHGKVSS